ncbi:DNA-binding response regulator, OmpR family, contains REC and winged-helix (wHTH) domain [Pseudoalteromonas denitrificans DSM 6059]|uniref:DNA-binding response regulator, OmpR family, contains REC and winged-helix (WHTH) domain n=1 Tax=Pseudoalteromonas denitrificans DSM 6059 TaxID=1123010 RepID=A0A1I1F2U0_9GAMM|nr:DNA-binding response regulator, OmpR family, contains REC and winged-helix (wHTH) domain [Pseudoalteromonas denitrificans DSM 6059]
MSDLLISGYGKILLVEDDLSLADWVNSYLLEQGFEVIMCHRGDHVVKLVKQHNPALILLDVMLPGMDGISVCRELRHFYKKPVLLLTAKGEEVDEVIGLEVGASDYIIKPVRPRALLARIKSALRNESTHNETPEKAVEINVGSLYIDLKARNVMLQGEKIAISNAEFSLLSFLASHAGEVVDRDAVFKATKGREYDGLDRSVDVLISALRKKIGDDPQNPQKIKTIWGQGYLLVDDAW